MLMLPIGLWALTESWLDYFDAVAEAILAAKSEIYIEDWWLSPELVNADMQ